MNYQLKVIQKLDLAIFGRSFRKMAIEKNSIVGKKTDPLGVLNYSHVQRSSTHVQRSSTLGRL